MVAPERHAAAMDKIVELASVRERCLSELSDRLAKAGFTPEETSDALETAVRCGLVDEERFARAFIRGKLHSGWAQNRIERSLRQKSIPDDVLERCQDEYPSASEDLSRALAELSRKQSHASDKYASYMRRLVSKGYSYDVARQAVKTFLADEAASGDVL
ncbi:MAG: recombination regulator RecX [Coriobacteriaceae bacterium]|nr:recombination regulator RecX [Coriobacteriaceae bacterium]